MWSQPPHSLSLESGEAHVWRTPLDQALVLQENLLSILTEDERVRGSRFHFEKHRRRFVVARPTLRILLARYLGAKPEDLHLSYGAYGKPALDGEHRNSRLRFNASHSHETVVYAFVDNVEVGIDLEYIKNDFATDEIANRFFSPYEVKTLRALREEERAVAFFRCWTRKEAFIKALGSGLSHPLDQFDVSLAPGEPAALLRVAQDSEALARWSLFDLDVGNDYAAALAVEGPIQRIHKFELDSV